MGSCRVYAVDIIVRGGLGEDCADVCPSGALVFENGRVVVDVSKCLACLACMALCGPDHVRVIVGWEC